MTHRIEDLDWAPCGGGMENAKVELAEGDSIANPSSTGRRIYGPAVVTFTTFEDGGIHTQIEDREEQQCHE